MTNQEFSDEFDVLYNNITSNQAPGLDEYEKSVFLTKAQDEIVKAYFDPKSNKVQEGFDGSERRLIDFSMLIRTANGTSVTPSVNIHPGSNIGYFAMPDNILLYINEVLLVTRGTGTAQLTVVPLAYNEYNRLMSKPFKRPLKNLAWRLITSGAANSYTYTDYSSIAALIAGDDNFTTTAKTVFNVINGKELAIEEKKLRVGDKYLTVDGSLGSTGRDIDNLATVNDIEALIDSTIASSKTVVEIIPGPSDTVNSYIVRYIARPNPIILTDLTAEGVTIGNGQQTAQTCCLDPIIHHEILQRAVELAKAAYTGDLNTNLALGVNSETPMGMLTSSKN